MKSPRRFILPAAIALIATATLLLLVQPRPGITAEIRNTGTAPMRNVVVHVTGHSYPLGDLGPGQSRSIRVNPTGESDLKLSYTDGTAAPQSLTAGVYFEPGYHGRLSVDVTNGQVTRIAPELNTY